MKKRFFYKHPILGGLIAMVLVMFICTTLGGFAQMGAVVMEMRAAIRAGEIADPGNTRAFLQLVRAAVEEGAGQTAGNAAVAVSALLCLLIFSRMNRKNGYPGAFRVQGRNLKDVRLFAAVFVVLDIIAAIVYLFTLPGGFPKIPLSPAMIMLALYAGFNEEISDRAIPAALMMRNKPTPRRILVTVLLTSVLFGAGHIVNLLAGRDLLSTLIQIVFASGAGLFFIAIYLRTGSVTWTIAIHVLHDLLIFMTNAVPEPETSLLINDLLTLADNFLPFVFGILMLLPKHHPAILETWAQIWPEETPADR